MMRARKVDQYYSTANAASPDTKMLTTFFTNCTNFQNKLIFSNIYLPVRQYDTQTQKLADDYTYINVGVTPSEIADIYWAEYSGCYLIGYHHDDIEKDLVDITTRANAIFRKNVGKYLKLIEMEGMEWNPLWNVDGSEVRQLLENNGTTDVETGQINTTTGVQWNDTKTTHNVSAYNSDVKKEYEDTVSGNGANIPTGIQRVEYTDGEFTVSNQSPSGSTIASADEATNGVKGSTKYVHNLAKNIINGEEADYVVLAKDTAFGQALTGADKMHVEKLIRQGNIGVVSTVQLLAEARENFRFNILDEFFRDINKVILIGTYDQ